MLQIPSTGKLGLFKGQIETYLFSKLPPGNGCLMLIASDSPGPVTQILAGTPWAPSRGSGPPRVSYGLDRQLLRQHLISTEVLLVVLVPREVVSSTLIPSHPSLGLLQLVLLPSVLAPFCILRAACRQPADTSNSRELDLPSTR